MIMLDELNGKIGCMPEAGGVMGKFGVGDANDNRR